MDDGPLVRVDLWIEVVEDPVGVVTDIEKSRPRFSRRLGYWFPSLPPGQSYVRISPTSTFEGVRLDPDGKSFGLVGFGSRERHGPWIGQERLRVN